MSEHVQYEALRASCAHWAKKDAQTIETVLRATFLRSFGLLRRDVQDKSLSEQKLCKSMDTLNLPMGFSHISAGSVEVYDSHGRKLMDTIEGHHFAELGNFVLCITPGQFFDLQQWNNGISYKPGDRLHVYKSIAPTLITLLPHGLGVLHGTTDEIQDKLHLKYCYST